MQKLVHVTLPQLRNTITTTSILMVITGVTNFDLFFIMTDGGPGHITMLPLYMYNLAFFSNEYGVCRARSPCSSLCLAS